MSASPAPEERVRLFVALSLPDPVREQLVSWQGSALGAVGGLRPSRPDALHATLCFLGWRSGGEVEAIAAACRELSAPSSLAAPSAPSAPAAPSARSASAAPAAPPSLSSPLLSLGEVLWLPPRRPRVVAVGLDDPSGALARVQAALSESLSAGGWYRPEKRPYLGHVTVARAARGARLRTVELPAPPAGRFEGRVVTLYRSRLERGGARYEALAEVELAS